MKPADFSNTCPNNTRQVSVRNQETLKTLGLQDLNGQSKFLVKWRIYQHSKKHLGAERRA